MAKFRVAQGPWINNTGVANIDWHAAKQGLMIRFASPANDRPVIRDVFTIRARYSPSLIYSLLLIIDSSGINPSVSVGQSSPWE